MSDKEVTFEDTKRCPKCDKPGRQTATNNIKNKRGLPAKVYTFMCENEVCLWYNTTWIVQLNPDGTVPQKHQGPKSFSPMSNDQLAMGQRYVEQLKEEERRAQQDRT